MANRSDEDPPFVDGSQSVPERPPEMPGPGRSATHMVVMVLCALVLLACVLWLLKPLFND